MPSILSKISTLSNRFGRYDMEEAGKNNGAQRKITWSNPFSKINFNFRCFEINWKDKETYKKYVIHIFVIFIFILSLVFVSLAWYYHHITEHAIASSQQIFFDPRLRVLTLSDPNGHDIIKAQLGQEIPSWQLPLHCPLIETGDQSKKECLWKRHAVLRVNHFYSPDKDIQCYNVSWESLNPKYVPYDCFDIGDVQWFGSSNLTYGSMPISGKFDYNSNEYSAGNEGVLQSAVEFYWITSNAVGLFVNNEIPTHVRWNTTREGQMCLIANFTVPFYDQDDKRLPRLNYTLCNGHDTLKTHTFMRNLHSDPEKLRMIDTKSLQDPHWSTVAEKKSRQITQADVENVARSVVKYGLNCSTIQIDGVWQSKLGNLEFDVSTFPNVTRMMEIVESSNCSISLEINPFFHFLSENYDHGVKNNFFVRDSGAYVPGLVHWQHGIASVLDVSNEKAHEWFVNSIKSINSNYKIDILRFTYGNSNWLPHRPHFNVINETPNAVRRLFTNLVYSTNPKLVIDNTAQTQNVASLLSVKASIITMGTKTCISDLIPKSLTLGILGYPFIMSDGFRSYHDKINLNAPNLPSKDLFIRWMQLSAFFPATSYSLSPWSFDDETVKVSKNASVLHETLIMPIIKSRKMMQDLHRGLSIMRPLWMANAGDSTAKSISDQFLIGDTLLVAPIVCESTVKRDIYIPAGIWNDQLRSTLVVGPKWLHDYHASLFEIPHFVFMRVYN
ncbi:hypothetical protein SNE40_014468 [Patella caerulea]|uniref:Uncharacterized protein n=1 Tax=Patella caerulea TaxID=87958 RepID=A0AAN8PQK5_PATCE